MRDSQAKFIVSVEGNALIKKEIDAINEKFAIANGKTEAINAEGLKIQTEFEKEREAHWEQVQELMLRNGLITKEEKQFGMFYLNKHGQIMFAGIDKVAKEKFEEEQEEKELSTETEAQEKGTSEPATVQ